MDDVFSKVFEVFAFEKLNKHQEDAIKFCCRKEKGCFCLFVEGISQVVDLSSVAHSVFVCAVHLWEKYRGRDFSIDKVDEKSS